MPPHITESTLSQFVSEAKPLIPVRKYQDSTEVVQRSDNQDDCDNNIELY